MKTEKTSSDSLPLVGQTRDHGCEVYREVNGPWGFAGYEWLLNRRQPGAKRRQRNYDLVVRTMNVKEAIAEARQEGRIEGFQSAVATFEASTGIPLVVSAR